MSNIRYWIIARTATTRLYNATFGFGRSELRSARDLFWDRHDESFMFLAKPDLLRPMHIRKRIKCSVLQAETLLLSTQQSISSLLELPHGCASVQLCEGVCDDMWYKITASRSHYGDRRLQWQFYDPCLHAQRIHIQGTLLDAMLNRLCGVQPSRIAGLLQPIPTQVRM